MKKTLLFLFLTSVGLITSCSKQAEVVELNQPENSEVNIPADATIVTAEETSRAIELELETIDGVLKFPDHETLISTLERLSIANQDVIEEWENSMGFTSLFMERAKLEGLTKDEQRQRLERGRLTELIDIEGDFPNIDLYDGALARVIDENGLFIVGDYIGTIGFGVNVWCKLEHKQKLIGVLTSNRLPENDVDLIVLDSRLFEAESRDFFITHTSCPHDQTFVTSITQHNNPDNNRKIRSKYSFTVLKTPRGNNRFDYSATMTTEITSKKGVFRYRTDHYHSHNIVVTNFNPNTPNVTLSGFVLIENIWRSAGFRVISSFNNVTNQFTIDNGVRYVSASPGTAWGQGHATSHRGMDGDFVRYTCN